jgi:hypothetical protein
MQVYSINNYLMVTKFCSFYIVGSQSRQERKTTIQGTTIRTFEFSVTTALTEIGLQIYSKRLRGKTNVWSSIDMGNGLLSIHSHNRLWLAFGHFGCQDIAFYAMLVAINKVHLA